MAAFVERNRKSKHFYVKEEEEMTEVDPVNFCSAELIVQEELDPSSASNRNICRSSDSKDLVISASHRSQEVISLSSRNGCHRKKKQQLEALASDAFSKYSSQDPEMDHLYYSHDGNDPAVPDDAESVSRAVQQGVKFMSPNVIDVAEAAYRCGVCKKPFRRRKSLQIHMLIHNSLHAFKCEICNKAFAQKGHLATHMLIHTKIYPFICNICNRSFTQVGNLNRHILIHNNVHPFECEICTKSFTRKGDLDRHILIHNNIRPFRCDVCNKLFTRKIYLNRHQFMHGRSSPFHCKMCGKSFSSDKALQRHTSLHISAIHDSSCKD